MNRYTVLKFNDYLIQEGLAEDIAGLAGISDSSSGQAEPNKIVTALKGIRVGEKNKQVEEIQTILKSFGCDVNVTGTLDSKNIEQIRSVIFVAKNDPELKSLIPASLEVDSNILTDDVQNTIRQLSTSSNAKDIIKEKVNKVKPQDYSVEKTNKSDDAFYHKLLKLLKAPVSEENMRFFYAWRQAEAGKATNNPFNTTFNLKKDPDMTAYNKAGVKNYSRPEYGLEATYRTLMLSYYKDIVAGLRNDIGASNLAKCESLNTWGTGSLVSSVINKHKTLNPPGIEAA
jgi:hypothetical protein